MSMSVNDVVQIVRVTSAIVSELHLTQSGVRCDGRNVGFDYEGKQSDRVPVLFSLDKESLIYDEEGLSRKQRHTLYGIAFELELNVGTYEDILPEVKCA